MIRIVIPKLPSTGSEYIYRVVALMAWPFNDIFCPSFGWDTDFVVFRDFLRLMLPYDIFMITSTPNKVA